MKIGSLFSGIGGLELGLEWAGVGHTVWQVEIHPFCRRVLERHWPSVTRYEDVRTVGSHNLELVDVLCGGFPCQDVSSAGKRVGLTGARSGLWYEYRRIVDELRPRFVLVENVESGRDRWLPFVRAGLEALGYGTRAFELSAADVGAPHRRKRIFVVADTRDYRRPERRAPHDGGQGGQHDEARHELDRRAPPVGFPPGPLEWDEHATTHYQPAFLGGSPRIPDRLDRFVALGNSVVPQCAEVIGRVLLRIAFPEVA